MPQSKYRLGHKTFQYWRNKMIKTATKEELLEMYDFVSPFSEELARVQKDGKWFHIHPNGEPAYEERYDNVGLFFEGLAQAQKDNKWFHIHPDGKPAYKERYYFVTSFSSEGLAWVGNDNKWFYIHPDGTKA